jgi:hypothetical protein
LTVIILLLPLSTDDHHSADGFGHNGFTRRIGASLYIQKSLDLPAQNDAKQQPAAQRHGLAAAHFQPGGHRIMFHIKDNQPIISSNRHQRIENLKKTKPFLLFSRR